MMESWTIHMKRSSPRQILMQVRELWLPGWEYLKRVQRSIHMDTNLVAQDDIVYIHS